MKKITIGFVMLLALLPNSILAANPNAKRDAFIPCYNGGLNFGLASFSTPINQNSNSQVSLNRNSLPC